MNNVHYDMLKVMKRPQAQALETWFHSLVLLLANCVALGVTSLHCKVSLTVTWR